MTQIWYEVFPLTLIDQHPTLLQSEAHPAYSPWMLTHQPAIHPNIVVIDFLNTILNPMVCNEKTIVHSTSWRYDPTYDWMLLTYLAILPQNHWSAHLQATSGITPMLMEDITAQYGDQLFPPQGIERQHVLAHALDHLASLNTYDPSIQSTLEPAWQTILRPRQPKPAGCLQRSSLSLQIDEITLHAGIGQSSVLVAGT